MSAFSVLTHLPLRYQFCLSSRCRLVRLLGVNIFAFLVLTHLPSRRRLIHLLGVNFVRRHGINLSIFSTSILSTSLGSTNMPPQCLLVCLLDVDPFASSASILSTSSVSTCLSPHGRHVRLLGVDLSVFSVLNHLPPWRRPIYFLSFDPSASSMSTCPPSRH